ncbi:MAG: hypothetical protein DRI89_04380 [Bacteroidetes bacterium]|nr:MAG: hypothetical protein DRI89_04380 [Bacteroidota bacterium]
MNRNKSNKIMINLSKFIAITILGFLITSCGNTPNPQETGTSDSIYVDYKFTDFFARDCCGVTGADGFYSVPLPDGRTVWIFGDSFLGTVNPDGSREKRSPVFIRNAFAVQDGDSLRSLYQIIDGWESSLLIPPEAIKGNEFSEDSLWYWPGDGFVENGKLKVFMTAFYQADTGNWGFRWTGANLATFSLPSLKLEKIDHFNYPGEVEIHWGHAVCDDDPDYTYIYGAGDKFPYVARAPKGNILLPWEFYTGEEWVEVSQLAKPMTDFKSSEQFSIIKLKDKYVLLTQSGDFLESSLYSVTSDLPYTGWKNKKELYKLKPLKVAKDLFAYNPVAHPEFTEQDELLVSYCVNSFNLEDLFQDASKYRPVFIRIPIDKILEE